MVGFQHLAFPKLEKHAQLESIILLHRTDNRFSASSETHVYLILEIYDYIHIYILYYHIIILKCLNKHTAYKIQAHDIINFDDHTMYMPFTFYFLILNDVMICTYQIFNYLEVKNQRFIYNMQ